MKKILLNLVIISVFSHFTISADAQYGTGIGARYGTDSNLGLTLLQFFSDRNQSAADFTVSAPFSGVRANGFYELHIRNHNEKIEVAHVGFFIGAGAHIGRYKTQLYRKHSTDPIDKTNIIAAGIDGIAGIEWKLPYIPLLLSLDVHPFLDLNYSHQPEIFELGLSLRYLF